MKPQHPDSDLNTPHFWRGVDAVTGGVFAIWYVFHGEELVDQKKSISMEFQNFPGRV
jgi:hypothetical protein